MAERQPKSAPETERNLGTQPIDSVMEELGLDNHALVAASTEKITHKMVARARKGRRLTDKVKAKIVRALNGAVEEGGRRYEPGELFTY